MSDSECSSYSDDYSYNSPDSEIQKLKRDRNNQQWASERKSADLRDLNRDYDKLEKKYDDLKAKYEESLSDIESLKEHYDGLGKDQL